jgi:TPR repeat protein
MRTPDELFQAGLECLQSNPSEAARLFEQAGKHEGAMNCLALIHKIRFFPEANPMKALELYTALKDEFNNMEAMFNLGVLYCQGGSAYDNPWDWEPEKGMNLIKKFLESADSDGNALTGDFYSTLGDLYCTGRTRRSGDPINDVTDEDLIIAIMYLDKALKKGDLSEEMEALTTQQLEKQCERLRLRKEGRVLTDQANEILRKLQSEGVL